MSNHTGLCAIRMVAGHYMDLWVFRTGLGLRRKPVPHGWNQLLLLLAAALLPTCAHAAFLSGEALDKAADVLALVVLFVVPIGVLVVFWLVHILPEKVAEKRHHPQKDAIHTVCTLSLFFGGLLWPIAWIWAYTKPVGYKLAYGTDKHEDYYKEAGDALVEGSASKADISLLLEDLDAMEKRGALSGELRAIRAQLVALEARTQEDWERTS